VNPAGPERLEAAGPVDAPDWLAPLLGNLGEIAPQMRVRGGAVAARARIRRPRDAAVLIRFGGSPHSGDPTVPPPDATVLLTQRATALRDHAGQVAFPGGATDPGDADAVATALREAQEETALEPDSVRVLAALDPVEVPVSGFLVSPVLAFADRSSDVRAVDPGETALVAEVPLRHLLDPANRFTVRKSFYRGPAFAAGPMLVWGFTGGLLSAIITAAGWERPWDVGDVRELNTELHRAAHRRELP
jgi:8-oxo-dGTP pyrophosphatase MutT (NUDIX family)